MIFVKKYLFLLLIGVATSFCTIYFLMDAEVRLAIGATLYVFLWPAYGVLAGLALRRWE